MSPDNAKLTFFLNFTGAKYDIKVIKDQLIPILIELEEIRYVIKRGTSYACIATESFKFLDITSYLAAGTSYDGFLKAYLTEVTKSFFPYEYFDTLEKLSSTDFPPYDSFYSSLRGKNTLEPSKSEKLTPNEIAVINRQPTKQQPITDSEILEIALSRYNELEHMFYDNDWTFRDFLIFYNNRYL